MKRILSVLIAIMSVFFVSTSFPGAAEAARVAVLPIQFSDAVLERANDFTSYYWDIMVEKFQYPEYELMDDEKISAVLPNEELKSFDKASLQMVAEKTDADVVVVMRLDRMEEKPDYFGMEAYMEFLLEGEYAGYNRLTDRYYHKKFHEKYRQPDELTYRNDYQQMTFVTLTKSYVYRTMKKK